MRPQIKKISVRVRTSKTVLRLLSLLVLFCAGMEGRSAWCGHLEKSFDIARTNYIKNALTKQPLRPGKFACAIMILDPDPDRVAEFESKGIVYKKFLLRFAANSAGLDATLDGHSAIVRQVPGTLSLEVLNFFRSIPSVLILRMQDGFSGQTIYGQLSVERGHIESNPRYNGALLAIPEHPDFLTLGYVLCSQDKIVADLAWGETSDIRDLLQAWVTPEVQEFAGVFQRAYDFIPQDTSHVSEDKNLLDTLERIRARRFVPGLRPLRKYIAESSGDLSPRSERAYHYMVISRFGLPSEVPPLDLSDETVVSKAGEGSLEKGINKRADKTEAAVPLRPLSNNTDPKAEAPKTEVLPSNEVGSTDTTSVAEAKELGRKFVIGEIKSPALRRFMRVLESEVRLDPKLNQNSR